MLRVAPNIVNQKNKDLLRIGCFYDGAFFVRVSNFYKHYHGRRAYLNFTGLQELFRQTVAAKEQIDPAMCQVVQSHFFRGRFSLQAAKTADALEADRFFDQLLMYAGILTHYYPMNETVSPPQEQGIDVWLALEAYDLAARDTFDVVVLFVSDQDFLPLIRKLHGIRAKVLLVSVEINYQDNQGTDRFLVTSHQLMHEASYRLDLSGEVEKSQKNPNPLIENLFSIPPKTTYSKPAIGGPRRIAH